MKKYMTQKCWESIVYNDKQADDSFVYAVKTTRIFCKPSCKARLPKKENVFIYHSGSDALDDGFRPCKKCNPLGKHSHDETWSIQIKNIVHMYYKEDMTLAQITSLCHGSPYHLSRLFKKENGITIMAYQHKLRMEEAACLLQEVSLPIRIVAQNIGYKTTSHFIKHFKKYYGQTPKAYQLSLNNRKN
ncbi:Ada metal-binding domain-containing protein [Staphylococcus edaphicus]|nr:Ada metal-binding domain-containing protein [Staphylococcus edaphicus]UQW80548.1 AraC family transcriptional regulator [Staphylococcus edaphicus]